MIRHGKGQANSFVINIDKTLLSEKDVLRQVETVFIHPRTSFVNKVIIIRKGRVIKVQTKK